MCILKYRIAQVEHLLTQPCKDSSRFLATTEGVSASITVQGEIAGTFLKHNMTHKECEGLIKFSKNKTKLSCYVKAVSVPIE